jgi:signal peptidase I
MEVGDIAIVVSTDTNKIQAGDIIQYQKEGEMTLHRVIEPRETQAGKIFITKGDANTAPDSDPVYPNQIKGKLLFTIPKLGWVSIALKEFFANAYTFLTALPQTLTTALNWTITNGVYLTTAIALTAYSYLLFSFKRKKKEEKT